MYAEFPGESEYFNYVPRLLSLQSREAVRVINTGGAIVTHLDVYGPHMWAAGRSSEISVFNMAVSALGHDCVRAGVAVPGL